MVQTVLFDCIDVHHPSQQCCSYAGREPLLPGEVLLGVNVPCSRTQLLCKRGRTFRFGGLHLNHDATVSQLEASFRGIDCKIFKYIAPVSRFRCHLASIINYIFKHFFFKYHAAFGIICFLTTFVCLSIDTFITLQT